MAKLIKIYPDNPNEKAIEEVVAVLRKGGLVIYPTDTVYGLGCDITNQKALNRLAKLKGIKLDKARWSFVCHDLSNLSDYVRQIDSWVFKILKKCLPGAFTFVLPSNNRLSGAFKKRKTVGIRVPDNSICQAIVERLGNPLVNTSIHDEDEIIEYTTDPELIYEKWEKLVDVVIDGGYGGNIPSTVVDFSNDEIDILREGKGDVSLLGAMGS